jgi:hypothetical protein
MYHTLLYVRVTRFYNLFISQYVKELNQCNNMQICKCDNEMQMVRLWTYRPEVNI